MPSGRQRRGAGSLLGQPNRFTTCRPPPPALNSPPQARPASSDAASPRTGGCRAWSHRSPRPGGCRRGRGHGENSAPPGRSRYRKGSRRSGQEPFGRSGRPRVGPAPRRSPCGSWRHPGDIACRSHDDRRRVGRSGRGGGTEGHAPCGVAAMAIPICPRVASVFGCSPGLPLPPPNPHEQGLPLVFNCSPPPGAVHTPGAASLFSPL